MTEFFTINTPDLVDSVRKASRIAAKRGHAFDLAAGIQFSLIPAASGVSLVVKSSDLDTHYRQVVPLISAGDVEMEPIRLPSAVLAAWTGHLATGEGSTTKATINNKTKRVTLFSESSKAEFTMIMGDSFPEFDAFDTTDLMEVDGLGQLLRRVSWACDRDSVPLCGIHIDGKRLIGCDGAKIAEVECEVPLDHAVTAPLTGVANAIGSVKGAVGIGIKDGRLLLSPDPDTQISSTLYEAAYPNVEVLRDRVAANVETKVSVSELRDALARIHSISGKERYPLVSMNLDGTEMVFKSKLEDIGEVQENFLFEEGLGEDEITMLFTPTALIEMCDAATTDMLTIAWPEDLNPLAPIKVSDGAGFSCIAMPRRAV